MHGICLNRAISDNDEVQGLSFVLNMEMFMELKSLIKNTKCNTSKEEKMCHCIVPVSAMLYKNPNFW